MGKKPMIRSRKQPLIAGLKKMNQTFFLQWVNGELTARVDVRSARNGRSPGLDLQSLSWKAGNPVPLHLVIRSRSYRSPAFPLKLKLPLDSWCKIELTCGTGVLLKTDKLNRNIRVLRTEQEEGKEAQILIRTINTRVLCNKFHMDLSTGVQKMSFLHQAGKGTPCLGCRGMCKSFEPHPWRKICKSCKCSQEDHSLHSDAEDDRKIGRLLADSKYSNLTARVKGGDGVRIYKRNRMIITNPIVSRKDPTFDTVTYEWAPPGLTQKLAIHYMDFIPKEMQPIAGTEGAYYRRKQLMRQLPAYDQDPFQCHALSESEVKSMQEFVRKYKSDVLGVGEVALPGQAASAKQDANQQQKAEAKEQFANGKIAKEIPQATPAASNGTLGESQQKDKYHCELCKQTVSNESPVVYCERAGYARLWHPACFLCTWCNEPLVDLIYFWKSGRLMCGRHYCESEKPRCIACDELIFSEDFVECKGLTWHKKHFCCLECDQPLLGKAYELEQTKLFCTACNKRNKHM